MSPYGSPERQKEHMTEHFTTTCDNCEREVKSVYMGVDLPDSGLYFSPNSMGYYAGFFDNFPPHEGEEHGYSVCHECAITFMRAMPGLAKRLLPRGGGHPIEGNYPDPPCCPWAWTWDEEAPCPKCGAVTVCIANMEMKWDKQECSCARLSP